MPQSSLSTHRILESAASLFAQQGFRLTTTRDIAMEAGVNQTTIFRQFKQGKHELSLAAVDHLAKASGIQAKLDAAYKRCDPSHPQTVEAVLQVWLVACVLHPKFINIIVNAMTERPDPNTAADLGSIVRAKYTLPFGSFINTFCGAAVKVGAMVGDAILNAEVLLGLLLGKIQGSIIRGNDFPKDISQAACLAHELVYIWLNGCAYRPAVSYQPGEPLFLESLETEELFQGLS